MKSILFIINTSDDGGAQKMIVTLYNEIKKVYPSSSIVFIHKMESQYSSIRDAYYLCDSLSSMGDYFKAIFRLNRLIRVKKPHAIISFLPLANILTGILGKVNGVQFRIVSQRNPSSTYGAVVRFADKILGSIGLYTANVCNSKSVMDAFSEYSNSYKSNLLVINNSVEKANFNISKDLAKERFNIDSNKIILTSIGRLHEQKDHEVIINAIMHISNKKDLLLLIAGSGPLEEYLTNMIISNGLQENVILLGNLSRSEIPFLLRAADVFLLPSKYEGLSNALIEAMSYGLPVICSAIPSFTSFLFDPAKNSMNGIIVDDSNPERWAEVIEATIFDNNLMLKYGEYSLYGVKDLSSEKMANKFVSLIER